MYNELPIDNASIAPKSCNTDMNYCVSLKANPSCAL